MQKTKKKRKKERTIHMFHDNAAEVRKEQIMHIFKEIHLSAPAKTQLSDCTCLYNKNVGVKVKKNQMKYN